MESKLPKPSGLKKPLSFTKCILPIDRIRTGNMAFGQLHKIAENNVTMNSIPSQPMPNHARYKGRAASPDLGGTMATTKHKRLRRSRSACDVRDMRGLKRPERTLAPIPAKTARTLSTAASSSALSGGNCLATTTMKSLATVSTIAKRPASASKSANVGKVAIAASKVGAAKKMTTATAKSTSTTGAGKPINRRIPPYDFKARYNDLLEKHKVLKEKYDQNRELIGNLENLPEQLEQSQTQLHANIEKLKKANIEIECLQGEVNSLNFKRSALINCLDKTKEELERLKIEYKKISSEHSALNTEVVELRQRNEIIGDENFQLHEELTTCREQVFRSNIERKELHNAVMDLRGNIRVFCRVRPALECEHDKLLCTWNYLDEATLEVQNNDMLLTGAKNKVAAHVFSFDHVFHPRCTQEDIFEMVSPLIQSALDGYNICIFAYGQTGSGKTYTMDGTPSELGVIPRTVDLLFDSIERYKCFGWEYEISVSFLEIYNEVLYDLLSNEQKEMEIRMTKNNKNDIYVTNIIRETVANAGRLRQLMQIAKMNRATAATVGNERSSRSHAVTKIELVGTHVAKNEVSMGSINLVDLAGSESPKTSIRMNETKNINRSLSELTNVILALLQKQDHIPYRNSKLTHLLMPSLGGNSKTLMFINVAPLQECFVESVKSLRFAANVNSCKMTRVKRNKFLNTSSSSTSFEK